MSVSSVRGGLGKAETWGVVRPGQTVTQYRIVSIEATEAAPPWYVVHKLEVFKYGLEHLSESKIALSGVCAQRKSKK